MLGVVLMAAAGALLEWSFWSRHTLQQAAIDILRKIESSLAGIGHVVGIQWKSRSRFEVPLLLDSPVFHNASIVVQVATRGTLVRMRSLWRKKPAFDTFTFRSDLELNPGLDLEMQTMRWVGRSRGPVKLEAEGWQFEKFVPIVVMTRLTWQKEIKSAIQSLLRCNDRENLNLEFHKSSPHFCATMPIEMLDSESESSCRFFRVLRTVAEGASAKAS